MIGDGRQRLIVGLSLLAAALAVAIYTEFEIFLTFRESDAIQTTTIVYLTVMTLGVVVSLTLERFSFTGVLTVFLCQGLAEYKALRLLAAAASQEEILRLRVVDLLGVGFVVLCIALAAVISGDSRNVYRINLLLLVALLPLVLQQLGWPVFSF